MTLSTDDIAILRNLLLRARAAGWEHLTYGPLGQDREHIWLSPKPRRQHRESVSLWHGAVEYREVDAHAIKSVIQAETAAEVHRWLLMLGLVEPTMAELAEAVLSS